MNYRWGGAWQKGQKWIPGEETALKTVLWDAIGRGISEAMKQEVCYED